MKRSFVFICLSSLILLLSCSQENKAITEMKKGNFMLMGTYVPIQQLVDGLAGSSDEVEWSSFDTEINSKQKKIVQIDIENDGVTYKLQFIYNSDRDIHQFAYGEINGKSVSMTELSMAMLFTGFLNLK